MNSTISKEQRKNWDLQGDRNTYFFHQAIIRRTKKNRITYLQNSDGSDSTTHDQLSATLIAYFQEIFSTQTPVTPNVHHETPNQLTAGINATTIQNDHSDNTIQPEEDDEQNASLCTNSVSQMQELHSIIKNMRSNASPGLDGLNVAFYKSAWPWISKDVHNLVTNFYTLAFMQSEINQTFIALIPKRIQPKVPQDFRPISLCNMIYKIIAESLADRLKPHLPNFIGHSQAAFIKNKHISSNIIITQESSIPSPSGHGISKPSFLSLI
jgi:hypothetical protein